jgi:UDP-hydrolysing UDP-N-acetyl-D-glucosamine 2-epimerase
MPVRDRASSRRRKIAVVSTSRADYGLLYWVLRALDASPRATLQLVLMGPHYSRAHGLTHRAVRADGFRPAAEIRTVPVDDSDAAVARSVGRATAQLADAFERLRPDLVVVLGDRIELLAVGSAATAFRLPIFHLHGGETTEGALDDAVRHAMTKLSHIHLPAAKPYAARIAAMGEERWRIRTVGAPGLDHLRRTVLPPPADVLARLGLPVDDGRPLFLVTEHPVTLRPRESRLEARAVAQAVSSFAARVVVTAPNTDQEHRGVLAELRRMRGPRCDVRFVANLGTAAYWSLLRAADVVVGNSSSSLLEAPSFGTPVVNVGNRQRGRLRARNVIDARPEAKTIRAAIARAGTPRFRMKARRAVNPYGKPGASDRIVRVLLNEPLDARLLMKRAPRGRALNP